VARDLTSTGGTWTQQLSQSKLGKKSSKLIGESGHSEF